MSGAETFEVVAPGRDTDRGADRARDLFLQGVRQRGDEALLGTANDFQTVSS